MEYFQFRNFEDLHRAAKAHNLEGPIYIKTRGDKRPLVFMQSKEMRLECPYHEIREVEIQSSRYLVLRITDYKHCIEGELNELK